MAAAGLKVISYAFKDVAVEDLARTKNAYHDESDEFRNEIESNLTYLCTFGLEDPLREGVRDSITAIRCASSDVPDAGSEGKKIKKDVNVRMVTGDHLETAKWVAV